MLEHVDAPVKAMIGPWDHDTPHDAWHSPRVEWRHEAVRWFDHWLDIETIPGHWRWEDGWPIERIEHQDWYATADHALTSEAGIEATHTSVYKPSMGLEGGGQTMWWGSVLPDQQPMDDDSLVYDSAPLDAPLEILGRPIAKLNVSADATRANWVVRISDVAPDGQVTFVAGAGFNGTHRNSARDPEDIVPGEVFPLDIEMHFTSWVFPKGHRIRVAISNAQWPMFWPTHTPTTTTLAIGGPGGAHVQLPVVPPGEERRPNFRAPQPSPSLAGYESLESGNATGYASIRSTEQDPDTGETFGIASDQNAYRYPWGIARFEEEIEHRTSDSNPARTSVVGRYKVTQELQGRTLEFEQEVEFMSDKENFYLTFHRWVLEDGELFAEKNWEETLPRDFQ
jgi:hypothetical protein